MIIPPGVSRGVNILERNAFCFCLAFVSWLFSAHVAYLAVWSLSRASTVTWECETDNVFINGRVCYDIFRLCQLNLRVKDAAFPTSEVAICHPDSPNTFLERVFLYLVHKHDVSGSQTRSVVFFSPFCWQRWKKNNSAKWTTECSLTSRQVMLIGQSTLLQDTKIRARNVLEDNLICLFFLRKDVNKHSFECLQQ